MIWQTGKRVETSIQPGIFPSVGTRKGGDFSAHGLLTSLGTLTESFPLTMFNSYLLQPQVLASSWPLPVRAFVHIVLKGFDDRKYLLVVTRDRLGNCTCAPIWGESPQAQDYVTRLMNSTKKGILLDECIFQRVM